MRNGLGREGIAMYTISNILEDIQRKTTANNMIETYFVYRLVYFVNFGSKSEKHYVDTQYDGLRSALESIIRENLTATNTVVVAAVTTLKDGKCVSLLGRAYKFSLEEYFRQLAGKSKNGSRKGNITYRRYAVR